MELKLIYIRIRKTIRISEIDRKPRSRSKRGKKSAENRNVKSIRKKMRRIKL